jgi:hypothetical protein
MDLILDGYLELSNAEATRGVEAKPGKEAGG